MAKSEFKKQSKSVGKVKKKSWIKIFSPKNMGNLDIGETYVEDPKLCLGRTVRVNLMQITNDIKSQTFDVKFEISNALENKLETRIIGYYYSASSLKRLIRRNISRIDDTIIARTKDNYLLIIKPILLTRSKVSNSLKYSLRMNLRKEIITFVNNTNYEDIFSSIVKYQLQKELREKLNKLYPIKNLEIRVLEEEKNKERKETELPKKKTELKAKKKNREEVKEIESKEISEDKEIENNENKQN